MIENQLYQLFQDLITKALNEVMNRELTPLLSRSNSVNRRLLTYTEAMNVLHISKPIFYRLLRENRLKRIKIDKGTFRIDPNDLHEFIDGQKP